MAMPLMKFALVTTDHDLITHRQYNLRKILAEGPKFQRENIHTKSKCHFLFLRGKPLTGKMNCEPKVGSPYFQFYLSN